MEYSALAGLPRTSRKRLVRHALASLGLVTIVVPLLGLPASGARGGVSPWWVVGIGLWLFSLASLAASVAIGGRITRAISFYLLEKIAALPASLVMLYGGLWSLREGLAPSSTAGLALGLACGFVVLPFVIRLRAKWMREAIARGHLTEAFNPETATWDPRHDADHVLRDPLLRRRSRLLSLLYWLGPALGLALVDIFGRITAAILAGSLAAGFGSYMLLIMTADLAVLVLELRRFERNLGREVVLPPTFAQG